MKKIESFTIDSSPLTSRGGLKNYTITGDPGAVFSLIIVNNLNKFYNFPEKTNVSEDANTFIPQGSFGTTPVKLFKQTINSQGIYNGSVDFPANVGDDKYTFVLQAESGFKTKLSENLSNNDIYHAAEINQYVDTRVTFALASAGSAGTYTSNPPANSYVAVGHSTNATNLSFNKKLSISWSIALGSSQFVIARQPVIRDFYFTTTRVYNNTGDNEIAIELTDISGLSVGMQVYDGAGVGTNNFIKKIIPGFKDENKSTASNHVYNVPKSLNSTGDSIQNSSGGTIFISNNSSWTAGDNLTIKGFGVHADSFNKTKFTISNLALTIDPVVTTTDAAVSGSTTIPITSTSGIKAADTVIMSGIGVTGNPHVDAVSSGVNVTASSAQTIENGQTVTFTGSSRNATITADVLIEKFGTDDLTLTLELDNILTVG